MATIAIMDPVTRIEGHMKVEVTIDKVGGRDEVVDARCTGTLFRGFETILTGRHPWDAPPITQRICGVCPVSHGLASSMALEAAAGQGFEPPANGIILRDLVLGADFLHSHILHFYLLAALDYVDGPKSAPFGPAWNNGFRSGLEGLGAHIVDAVKMRRMAHEMGAVFGGKMPHPGAYVPGGFTSVPTVDTIAQFRGQLRELRDFIENIYIPDVQTLSDVYPEYLDIGRGWGNLLAYGVFHKPGSLETKLLDGGYVDGGAPEVQKLETALIAESVRYSWYNDATEGMAPEGGATEPDRSKKDAYSWLKAPRYAGSPAEAGPLARMWINGNYNESISVMGRHMARAKEALLITKAMDGWLDELNPGEPVFNEKMSAEQPINGTGVGLTEASRGALGHWVEIKDGAILNYQIITPTCWNASPKDVQPVAGPIEKALIGTPIQHPDRPLEALRVIHSFDPCMSCAVHVMRPNKKPIVMNAGLANS